MEKAALFDVVTAQRQRLIGVLDDVSDEQWNTQSLCERWRVRDVGRAFGFVPGKRTKGLRFEATDLDWSAGDGALVSGPAEAILLAVANRPIALRDLGGDGANTLGNRIG